jgi:hypothetical protein
MNNTNILKKKEKKNFSNQLKQYFSLISFKPDFSIMGSGNIRSIMYPSDYDLFQEVVLHKNKNEALNEIVRKFKSIFTGIKNNKNIYLTDFKCGIDKQLFFKHYENLNAYQEYLTHVYNEKLIDKKQYHSLLHLKNPDEIMLAVKKLYILRWTVDEVIQGYKKLSNNRVITLKDSILDNTMIKIDIMARIKYSEFVYITEVYVFKVGDSSNTKINSRTILNNVIEEKKQLFLNHKYYKALKRLFTILSYDKEYDKAKELVKFFNCNVGLLNMIKQNLENYSTLLEKVKSINLDEIKFGIQIEKEKLGRIYQFILSNDIFEDFEKMSKINNRHEMILELNRVSEILDKIVQSKTKNWLKYHKQIYNLLV